MGDTRRLMGPGPSNPYPEAMAALAAPALSHEDPVFLDILDEVRRRLRIVFETANELTFPVSGTGSAAMETAFVNTITPGDTVVVAVNGFFGERMCDMALRCGANLVRVDFDWGAPVDAERLLAAHPDPAIIAVVHAETSTGARSDIAAVGEGKGDALLVVDCVTSLGAIPFRTDAWGVDIAFAATQKCLSVPAGLGPFTINERARRRLVARPGSWYLDLRLLAEHIATGGGRAYHHSAPVAAIRSLHGGLGAILDEGLDAVFARHETCGAALERGLVELGLEPDAAAGSRLPQLAAVWVPDGVDDAATRARLRDDHGIQIGGGLGRLAGEVWRIGCMGHTARMGNVDALLASLEALLAR